MARSTSFRLPAELLDRLEQEATGTSSTVTTLVTSLLDEGLKTRRVAGIAYRDGPAGRRAGVIGGPDVWEIVRAFKNKRTGDPQPRLAETAEEAGIALSQVGSAIDFYIAFPQEIDDRIAADEQAASRLREVIERRTQFMSG